MSRDTEGQTCGLPPESSDAAYRRAGELAFQMLARIARDAATLREAEQEQL